MSESTNDRQFYTETYDVCVGDWPGEIDFYQREIEKLAGTRPCKVLELACGTGW
jgi:hypothetical protein